VLDAEALRALRPFLRHTTHCRLARWSTALLGLPLWREDDRSHCTCGLDAAVRAALRTLAAGTVEAE
jgi:hypothetical protein